MQEFQRLYREKFGLTEANIKVLQFRALKRAATLERVVGEPLDISV